MEGADCQRRLVRLLPCPFCGSDAEMLSFGEPEYDEDYCCETYPWYVACKGLNCSAVIPSYKHRQHVVEAWNRRAAPNALGFSGENLGLYALDPKTGVVSKVSEPNALGQPPATGGEADTHHQPLK